MKEQKFEEEVVKILNEIPNGRRALLQNYDNLLNVAEYCHNNYIQVIRWLTTIRYWQLCATATMAATMLAAKFSFQLTLLILEHWQQIIVSECDGVANC